MPRNNNVETIVLDRNIGTLTRRIRQVAYLSDKAGVDSIMGQFQESAKQTLDQPALGRESTIREKFRARD